MLVVPSACGQRTNWMILLKLFEAKSMAKRIPSARNAFESN